MLNIYWTFMEISTLSASTNSGLTDDAIHFYAMSQLECWLPLNKPHQIWMRFAISTNVGPHIYRIQMRIECNNSRCHRKLCAFTSAKLCALCCCLKYTRAPLGLAYAGWFTGVAVGLLANPDDGNMFCVYPCLLIARHFIYFDLMLFALPQNSTRPLPQNNAKVILNMNALC